MKKLMFGLAVAGLCGAVFADVTSANVVGYQGLKVETGLYNYRVATFDKVDGSTFKLGDLGVDENWDSSTLSFLVAANGATRKFEITKEDGGKDLVAGFMYIHAEDLEDTEFEGQPGWYYADEETGELFNFNNVEVPYGSMFYVEGAEKANVVVSGSVVSGEDIPLAVETGVYNYMGNCTPVDLTLGDIGVDEDWDSSTLSFLIPESGATRKFEITKEGGEKDMVAGFMYIHAEDLEDTEFEGQPGWYYADEETGELFNFNNVDIPAGTMFYIEGAEKANILVPAAL